MIYELEDCREAKYHVFQTFTLLFLLIGLKFDLVYILNSLDWPFVTLTHEIHNVLVNSKVIENKNTGQIFFNFSLYDCNGSWDIQIQTKSKGLLKM